MSRGEFGLEARVLWRQPDTVTGSLNVAIQRQQEPLRLAVKRSENAEAAEQELELLRPLLAHPGVAVRAVIGDADLLWYRGVVYESAGNADSAGPGYRAHWYLSPFGYLELLIEDAGVGDHATARLWCAGQELLLPEPLSDALVARAREAHMAWDSSTGRSA